MEKKIIYILFFLVACYCLFLLTQSRMNLLALGLGFFLLLLSSNFNKKYFIAIFIVVVGLILYTSSSLFSGVKEASKDQAQNYKEDIRLQAQDYFLNKLQGGIPTLLIGNGFPSETSQLGIQSASASLMGYWTSDVGLTGIFSYFGILGVLVWIFLFYFVFKMKLNYNAVYIKAYFLTLLTTAFVGYSIFDPGYMPSTVLALILLRYES